MNQNQIKLRIEILSHTNYVSRAQGSCVALDWATGDHPGKTYIMAEILWLVSM